MSDNILAFDTSAAHCAVGVLWGGEILFNETREMIRGQGEALAPMIAEALGSRDKSKLQRIAVGIGPGNFTGTRISVSLARGLALALKIPAIGISNFELLYTPSAAPKDRHTRVLAGPRGTFYAQDFEGWEPLGGPYETPDGHLMTPSDVPTRLIAYATLKQAGPRPAPLYIRPPDAALPSTPPPRHLP